MKPPTRKQLIAAIELEAKAQELTRREVNAAHIYPMFDGHCPSLHDLRRDELAKVLASLEAARPKPKRKRGTLPCEVEGCEEPADLLAGAFGAGAFRKDKRQRCSGHWRTAPAE